MNRKVDHKNGGIDHEFNDTTEQSGRQIKVTRKKMARHAREAKRPSNKNKNDTRNQKGGRLQKHLDNKKKKKNKQRRLRHSDATSWHIPRRDVEFPVSSQYPSFDEHYMEVEQAQKSGMPLPYCPAGTPPNFALILEWAKRYKPNEVITLPYDILEGNNCQLEGTLEFLDPTGSAPFEAFRKLCATSEEGSDSKVPSDVKVALLNACDLEREFRSYYYKFFPEDYVHFGPMDYGTLLLLLTHCPDFAGEDGDDFYTPLHCVVKHRSSFRHGTYHYAVDKWRKVVLLLHTRSHGSVAPTISDNSLLLLRAAAALEISITSIDFAQVKMCMPMHDGEDLEKGEFYEYGSNYCVDGDPTADDYFRSRYITEASSERYDDSDPRFVLELVSDIEEAVERSRPRFGFHFFPMLELQDIISRALPRVLAQAASVLSSNDYLLHLVIQDGLPWDIIEGVAEAAPEILACHGKTTGLLPFQVAAATFTRDYFLSSVDITMKLLLLDPSVLTSKTSEGNINHISGRRNFN